jgi:hypothetical protein
MAQEPSTPSPQNAAQGGGDSPGGLAPETPYPPPQSEGAPRRLFTIGSPMAEERLNVAVRILRDPVARTSFTKVYSGQARNWRRR